jgi:hypothetical protein
MGLIIMGIFQKLWYDPVAPLPNLSELDEPTEALVDITCIDIQRLEEEQTCNTCNSDGY